MTPNLGDLFSVIVEITKHVLNQGCDPNQEKLLFGTIQKGKIL